MSRETPTGAPDVSTVPDAAAGRTPSPSSVDDERRERGIPRTRDTPCAWDGCPVTSPLLRVNPKGERGVFMCPEHARRTG